MQFRKNKQEFAIRKLTIGAAAVLLSTTFYLSTSKAVYAASIDSDASSVSSASTNSSASDASAKVNLVDSTGKVITTLTTTGKTAQKGV